MGICFPSLQRMTFIILHQGQSEDEYSLCESVQYHKQVCDMHGKGKMKKRVWSVFILALPYVITVLFPIISVMCLSFTVMNNYNEKILADKQVNIERAFESFLQKVGSVETLANAIAKNDEILEYIYGGSGNSGHTALDYLEFREVLYSYLVNNNVEMIYYYDAQQNKIISSEGTYSNVAKFLKADIR